MEKFSIRDLWNKKRLNNTLEKNYKLMVENHVTTEQINFLMSDETYMASVLEICEDLVNNKNTEASQKLQRMGTTKALIALALLSEKARLVDNKKTK